MRRIEEVNKFELVLDIKALIALAPADELIEGGMSVFGPFRPFEAELLRPKFGDKRTLYGLHGTEVNDPKRISRFWVRRH